MPSKIEIKENQTFNQLTVIKELPKKGLLRQVQCKCSCGNIKDIALVNLRTGRTKSCGCLKSKNLKSHTTHGLSKTKEYKLWTRNKENMCTEWKEDFLLFKVWYDKTFKFRGYYLIRKDLDKPLDEENARLTPFRESTYHNKLFKSHRGVLVSKTTKKYISPLRDLKFDPKGKDGGTWKFTCFVPSRSRFHTWTSEYYQNARDNIRFAYEKLGYMKDYIDDNFDWECLRPINLEKMLRL